MAEWSSIGFRLIIVSSQHVVGSKDLIILLLAHMGCWRDMWSTAAPLLGAPYTHTHTLATIYDNHPFLYFFYWS